MEVILKKDVQNLGEEGDIVTVKDGYARNLLLPQNLAEIATKGALANREKSLERIKAKQAKLHQQALEIAEKINALETLQLNAKAGESGKLFGTITTKKLAEELNDKLNVQVDRKSLTLNNPISHIGSYQLTVKISSKVKAQVNVVVSASEVLQEKLEQDSEKENI